MQPVDGALLRQTILGIISRHAGGGSLQSGSVLRDTMQALGIRRDEATEQAALTYFGDLFRIGYLSWGLNIDNPNPPFFHLTELGRRALSQFSRDPANADGYLAYLDQSCHLAAIARSYIDEAVRAYNATCFRASAVLIGCASESVVLTFRDEICASMDRLGLPKPKNLVDWRVSSVLRALDAEIRARRPSIDARLFERFEAHWGSFSGQIRLARNQAGHPSSLDPVDETTVHAGLLVFPELARLANDLRSWIAMAYV